MTLEEFLTGVRKAHPESSGELNSILHSICGACKIIHREVNRAGLANILGQHDSTNISGDQVAKLDVYSNELIIDYMRRCSDCAGIASEEMDEFVDFGLDGHQGNYIVFFDPLDGSSNIDVNAPLGTIFAVYKRVSPKGTRLIDKDFLQTGNHQVAAGYVLYGSSTMLVYSTGGGVHGFTYDPSIGEFCLSHPEISIPYNKKDYCINQGHFNKFTPSVQKYIQHCMDQERGLRYIGTMVGDMHRILLKGGIFIYPSLTTHPNGKLRLNYECNPISYLVESAGGASMTCDGLRILDIQPNQLHQKVTIASGSLNLVQEMKQIIA